MSSKNGKNQFEVWERVIHELPDGRKCLCDVVVPRSRVWSNVGIVGFLDGDEIIVAYVNPEELQKLEPEYEEWLAHFLSEMADQLENKHDK